MSTVVQPRDNMREDKTVGDSETLQLTKMKKTVTHVDSCGITQTGYDAQKLC